VKATFYNKKLKFKNNFVFLDIGFERTTAWFFIDHKFVFFNSINLGGNSITKDISKVLDLDMDYSENLKKNFNIDENDFFNKDQSKNINLYSEIQKKNISIDKLKNIIQARVDEIIELAVYKNHYFKDTNNLEIQSLIFIGSGSKILSNNTNFEFRKSFQELIFLKQNESTICDAGLSYDKSDESQLVFSKKKSKRAGFFERFFNLFSK
jgi:Tfp pilus assembly PilM family ATPase